MKQALVVLNELCDEGVIGNYAIGGAMGALFYTEPVSTMDLDVFVFLKDDDPFNLMPLSPIYAALKERGYLPDEYERECINIEGTPVQILPACNALLEDAVEKANAIDYEGVKARVMTAEHLAAISVQTGRVKDKLRVQMFWNTPDFDRSTFLMLLSAFSLRDKFEAWGLV